MIGIRTLRIQQGRIIKRIVSQNKRIPLDSILHKQPSIRASQVLLVNFCICPDAIVADIFLIRHQQIAGKLTLIGILALTQCQIACAQQDKQHHDTEMSHSLQRNKKARIFVDRLCPKSLFRPPQPPQEHYILKVTAVP